ncbi:Tyrosine-protein kinase SPK-1 [Girardia tigrina] [Rhizoctonia solani]|uniref:Tyrosine-protein kinase SPK-1 [Girardia tigrina] n=1 Tax=Rhizoctonia solani TaxID=456999 RepID=A0A0K6FLS0_9AGAM|nr:Tyrosine-protein kinase SPK-1 [Girardia tigrina] [Rhizoctonia solani]
MSAQNLEKLVEDEKNIGGQSDTVRTGRSGRGWGGVAITAERTIGPNTFTCGLPPAKSQDLATNVSLYPSHSSSLFEGSLASSDTATRSDKSGSGSIATASDLLAGMPVSVVPRQAPATSGAPVELNTIGHLMSITEIVAQLENHGCRDVTALLDFSTSSAWPISTGGFGDVYKVNLMDSTEVAVKTTRIYVSSTDEGKKSLKHAARELYTWSKCDHRNVIKLLGLVIFRGQLGMVSLWMAHGNLPHYLSRYPQVDRCIIATQISEGLAYLHINNIVHGDLKGMNVLISSDGIPVLSDFGNAVLNSQSLCFTATTTTAAFSLRWTAPEILSSEGSSVRSKEADVYSLGMTILEAITGKPPYSEKSEQAVMFCVWRGVHPERPTEISPQSEQGEILWLLLGRCWSNDIQERPSSAEVAEAMGKVTRDGLRIPLSSDQADMLI